MKYYMVETERFNKRGEAIDTWLYYEGTDLSLAKKEKERRESGDTEEYVTSIKVYTIPDDTDLNDTDSVINALVEAIGYDTI